MMMGIAQDNDLNTAPRVQPQHSGLHTQEKGPDPSVSWLRPALLRLTGTRQSAEGLITAASLTQEA